LTNENITCPVKRKNPMGRGQWTRWGRGLCEGWSFEIGMAFRGSVVRRDVSRERTAWIASINSTGLGEFLEREIAMRRVEELVESSMGLVLHDWGLYQAAKKSSLKFLRRGAADCGQCREVAGVIEEAVIKQCSDR
jgi:hypothetical protein